MFPTSPTVARHAPRTFLVSPLLSLKITYFPSLPRICTLDPALLANLAPAPGFNSTLWTKVPTGIFSSGNALPTLISALTPLSILSPTFKLSGAIIYLFSPSA